MKGLGKRVDVNGEGGYVTLKLPCFVFYLLLSSVIQREKICIEMCFCGSFKLILYFLIFCLSIRSGELCNSVNIFTCKCCILLGYILMEKLV